MNGLYNNHKEERAVYYQENKEEISKYDKKYNKAHKKEKSEYNKKYTEEHREKKAEYDKEYNQTDKGRTAYRKSRQKRRAQKTENEHEDYDFEAICAKYGDICVGCGCADQPLTVDHVIPISKGGADAAHNIQPLCQSCNSHKGTKTIDYR